MEELAGNRRSDDRFDDIMRKMPEDELITALKKRRLYQPEAAAAAIREALRRGVIRKEEDLETEKFSEPEKRFTLFPFPEKLSAQIRLFRSLCRGLLVSGVIPGYYGVLKFTLGKYVEGAALVSFGAIWVILLFLLMTKFERRLVFPLIFIAVFALIYATRLLFQFRSLSWFDILVPIVLFGVILYSLLYVRAVSKNLKKPDPAD